MTRDALAAAITLSVALATAAEQGERPNWGVSFWAHDYYTGDAVFADATKQFQYAKDSMDVPRTGQGVPLQPAKLISFLSGYPTGVYKLSYEGKGEITFGGRAGIVPGSLRKEDGFTHAEVKLASGEKGKMVEMRFRNVDANDPARNVRLICPGFDVDTTRVVRDEFIRRVQPFTTLRFMDWNATNGSKATKSAERRRPDYLVQIVGWRPRLPMGGMAYELMVAVCNEAKKEMWICVPHLADDECVRELATLLRDGLDPERKCIVELSNELWSFSQGPELGRKMIKPDWDWRNSGGVTLYYGAVAPRLAQVSRVFKQVWGDEATGRLEIVLAGQSANPWHVAKALEYYTDHNIRPKDVIEAIAIAPYFRPHAKEKYTDYEKMMQDMLEQLESRLLNGIRRHKALADEHGLKLYAYEGGQHFWYNVVDTKKDPSTSGFIGRAQTDPRMREAYRRYVALWEREGGDLFMHYTFTSGSWGLLPDLAAPGSIKWDAVLSCLLPAGDATLDGEVRYDDFLTLKANFGEADRWWEQGDSNDDRKVDAADLRLLMQDLAGLRPDQRAKVEAFAAEHSAP